MNHQYYALAEQLLEDLNQIDNGDEEATDVEDLYQEEAERRALDDHDLSICVCGDPYCHGCPSHDELVREGIIGDAGEEMDGDSDWEYEADDNSQGTAKWT
jgi:hypothetical protein